MKSVERLASELQGKNDELEKVLEDLQRAQDQIVMREKLAELGQLTAGVAHEIKNPLNFVMNLSQVSKELLDELQETIAEGEEGEALSSDQRSLIEEISQDLSGNLERIRTHGNRANRIVQDMLAMGRGAAPRLASGSSAPQRRPPKARATHQPKPRPLNIICRVFRGGAKI